MLLTTSGIVLRAVKYSETSFITDIYTEAKGLRHFIISGVRKSKSKTGAALFQPGTLLRLETYFRDDKHLNRIKEAGSGFAFRQIPFVVPKMAVSVFMAELCSKTIKEAEPNPGLFDFLWNSFVFLDGTPDSTSNLPVSFMCRLTMYLGIMPETNGDKPSVFDIKEGAFKIKNSSAHHVRDDELIPLLNRFFFVLPEQSHTLATTRAQRKALLKILERYYAFHIAGFTALNSPDVYGEIF